MSSCNGEGRQAQRHQQQFANSLEFDLKRSTAEDQSAQKGTYWPTKEE